MCDNTKNSHRQLRRRHKSLTQTYIFVNNKEILAKHFNHKPGFLKTAIWRRWQKATQTGPLQIQNLIAIVKGGWGIVFPIVLGIFLKDLPTKRCHRKCFAGRKCANCWFSLWFSSLAGWEGQLVSWAGAEDGKICTTPAHESDSVFKIIESPEVGNTFWIWNHSKLHHACARERFGWQNGEKARVPVNFVRFKVGSNSCSPGRCRSTCDIRGNGRRVALIRQLVLYSDAYQSRTQCVSRSINQLISQSDSHSQLVCQSVSQSINQWISQWVNQTVSQTVNQLVHQSVS